MKKRKSIKIDYEDWRKLKEKSLAEEKPIKEIINSLLKELI